MDLHELDLHEMDLLAVGLSASNRDEVIKEVVMFSGCSKKIFESVLQDIQIIYESVFLT